MDTFKCLRGLLLLALAISCVASEEEATVFDRGYRSLYRVYEECQQRNVGFSPCLKKKAIAFFERLGRVGNLPIAENLELVRDPDAKPDDFRATNLEVETSRTAGAAKDEILNDILFERISALMNGFNLQIRMPKTNPDELKRSIEEGRGKMKKMMGMMMTGMAMKMAAMVPLAMGVLFLLAGKALIISKIALVLSMIIGLKKLLAQKNQGGGGGHGWQSSGGGGGGGGGWDRSLKGSNYESEYAHNLAYSGSRPAVQGV